MKKFLFSLLLLSFLFAYTDGYSVYPNLECNNLIVNTSSIASGTTSVGTFLQVDFQDSVDTSATDNATITLAGSMQLIDTWSDNTTSTVDYITTSNVDIGTSVWLLGNATRNIVLSESGNMILGGSAQTVTSINIVKLIMTGANQFIIED